MESLLEVDSRARSDFMGVPAVELINPGGNGTAAPSWIGRRSGPYKLAAEIGHGGIPVPFAFSPVNYPVSRAVFAELPPTCNQMLAT